MSENPYKLITRLATKYSRSATSYDEVLDDLRELTMLIRLNTCLDIKSHRVYLEPEITSLRIVLAKGVREV